MKTVLFCPGFGDSIDSIDYRSVMEAIESKGYKIVFIPLRWKRTTIADWVKQLEQEYQKYDAQEVVLAGFSYGAVTCFVAATRRNPAALWLFSLSPYFAEDIPHVPKSWANQVGKRRMSEFKQLHFKELAKDIQCTITLAIGDLEHTLVKNRVNDAHTTIKSSVLVVAPDTLHNVADKNYIEVIRLSI
jgi:predicted alpha/beta hydrolase family esterase